jgi:pilus assembly protein CpaB
MKRKFYVFMAVVSGLVFGFSVYYYLQSVKVPALTETKPLVIAATDIPARSIVQKDQLEIKNIPVEGYPQGGASALEDVSGKILLINLRKSDVLLSPMLESTSRDGAKTETAFDSFSIAVPQGKRAVAIPVGLAGGVNHKIKPGDRVDVLVTMDIRDEKENSKTITSLAAQDVLVLNTGDNTLKDSDKIQASASYILALSVPQAMSVTLGSEKGSIRLILRNPINKEIYNEKPVDPSIYLGPDYFSHYK